MKKIFPLIILSLIFTFAFTFNFTNIVFATETEPLNKVFDNANLLTENEEIEIQTKVDTLISEYNMDFVILTIDDAEGKTAREYADDFYDYNGFGFDSVKSGALFLIDMDNREVYISTTGDMIDILSDARIESVLDVQSPYVSSGDYVSCFTEGIDKVEYYISLGPEAKSYRVDEDTGKVTETYGKTESELKKETLQRNLLISFGVGLVSAIGSVIGVFFNYKKEFKEVNYDYRSDSNMNLTRREDILINKFVTQRHIPPPSSGGGSSGGGGGGSSTHSSSSGSSHGGGGRSF